MKISVKKDSQPFSLEWDKQVPGLYAYWAFRIIWIFPENIPNYVEWFGLINE